MIRTQVYLPQSQIKYLKNLSRINNTSVSEEMRRAIESLKDSPKKATAKSKKLNSGQFLMEMAREAKKLNFNGPKDLASNIDKYLYGQK